VLWQNVAVLWEYVAVLWQNVAVLWEYVAVLWQNVAVLWEYVAMLWQNVHVLITCEPFIFCQISLRCLANVRCRIFPDSFMSQAGNEHRGSERMRRVNIVCLSYVIARA
jgi:hypothetical protein